MKTDEQINLVKRAMRSVQQTETDYGETGGG